MVFGKDFNPLPCSTWWRWRRRWRCPWWGSPVGGSRRWPSSCRSSRRCPRRGWWRTPRDLGLLLTRDDQDGRWQLSRIPGSSFLNENFETSPMAQKQLSRQSASTIPEASSSTWTTLTVTKSDMGRVATTSSKDTWFGNVTWWMGNCRYEMWSGYLTIVRRTVQRPWPSSHAAVLSFWDGWMESHHFPPPPHHHHPPPHHHHHHPHQHPLLIFITITITIIIKIATFSQGIRTLDPFYNSFVHNNKLSQCSLWFTRSGMIIIIIKIKIDLFGQNRPLAWILNKYCLQFILLYQCLCYANKSKTNQNKAQ